MMINENIKMGKNEFQGWFDLVLVHSNVTSQISRLGGIGKFIKSEKAATVRFTDLQREVEEQVGISSFSSFLYISFSLHPPLSHTECPRSYPFDIV